MAISNITFFFRDHLLSPYKVKIPICKKVYYCYLLLITAGGDYTLHIEKEETMTIILKTMPELITGAVSSLLYIINTIFWVTPLMIVAFVKLMIPVEGWRSLCNRILNGMANTWISFNNLNMRITKRIQWDVHGIDKLKPDGWYLVLANHQSWVDILVLQKIFNRKIPFLKFFLKKELKWVPLLGMAWWALDFPFMKRYSQEFIKKHPHLIGKDIDITRKACEKFKSIPVSIMNFVEGTRFSREKHTRQESPFRNLLRPKAGGIAFVLSTMGEQLNNIVNVTITYPKGVRSFWDFLCGKVKVIRVRVETLPITKELRGDYTHDPGYRERFQEWLNNLWSEKDLRIESMGKF